MNLQVYLNGEPIFALQPVTPAPTNKDMKRLPSNLSASVSTSRINESEYMIKRLHHSIGEVSCVCLEEYVSLPPDAALSVRYHAAAAAQAFLSLRKL